MATINSKSTKAEILQAYKALQKEKQEVEKQLRSSVQEVTKLKKQAPVASSKPMVKEKTVVKVVGDSAKVENIEGIILNLENIEKGLGKAMSEVSNKLTVEAEALAELSEEINEEKEELAKLYDLKVENGILDELVNDYEESKTTFEEESDKKRKEFEEDIAEKRKNWNKDQDLHYQKTSERDEENGKRQEREREEHEYNLELERSLKDDEYEQRKKALQLELDELRESKETAWAADEKMLNDLEKEFNDYKVKFEEIPEKLDKAIKKAEAEGKAVIERDAKEKAELIEKEVESDKRIFELTIESLDNTIKSQNSRITSLAKQLENALQQAQDLAVKAIEGSANSESFNAIREIAIEQAKTQTKSK
jgi:chromosome segregation ATPase